MSTFVTDGRWTDPWVVDKTLFEHLSGVRSAVIFTAFVYSVFFDSMMGKVHLLTDWVTMLLISYAVFRRESGHMLLLWSFSRESGHSYGALLGYR